MRAHITVKDSYRNSWVAAAAVVFAVWCLLSSCASGQDMPPMPPVFAVEKIITQPTPDYMLLSPHTLSYTNDAAMVSLLWDYSVPTSGGVSSPVSSPKGAEIFLSSTPMAAIPQYVFVISNTCTFHMEFAGQWTNWRGEIERLWTWGLSWEPGTILETSTNLVDWELAADPDPAYGHDMVGYMPEGWEKRRYFRARYE